MKKQLSTFMVGFILFCCFGCSNPYCAPDTSKALTEKEQLKEQKNQTILMQNQAYQLQRIADALEKLKK